MTCIVAAQHEGSVWMGADSCVSNGDEYSISTVPKCWKVGDPAIIMGASGDVKIDNLLIPWKPPRFVRGDPRNWTRTRFIPALRRLLADAIEVDDDGDPLDFDLLLGVGGRLMQIESDFGLKDFARGYAAIGVGANPALGVLYATPRMTPRKRIKLALEASEACITCVRRPWVILEA